MKRIDDYYARLARNRGYPARSVFKLQEIQKRFRIIKPGCRILDIGASPGSWSQYCLELLADKGWVVAVDLIEQKLKRNQGLKENYHFIKGNIFDPEIEGMIVEQGPYDLILSDAAPATSGNRIVDTQASLEIARKVLRIAHQSLNRGGSLVVKLFQGGEEGRLLTVFRWQFVKARTFKPQTSRKGSKEIFFLGFGYINKKTVCKIADGRLL